MAQIRTFEQPMGSLQRRLIGGDFNPYGSELGDGTMAKLAAQELRTGEDYPVPMEPERQPSDAEKILDLLKQIIRLAMPKDLVPDPNDKPHWKFRRGKWIDPEAEKAKKKSKKKGRRPGTRKAAKKRKK